jgi:hypothetical protein
VSCSSASYAMWSMKRESTSDVRVAPTRLFRSAARGAKPQHYFTESRCHEIVASHRQQCLRQFRDTRFGSSRKTSILSSDA